MTLIDIPLLYTPEELEEHFGSTEEGRKKLAASSMREMVRDGRVSATRGPRNSILFTPAQARAMLDVLVYSSPTEGGARPQGNPFNMTRRSRARA